MLLKLIRLRAKEHINTNKAVLSQNPNLWDELQGIHMRETTDAYYHVFAIEQFSNFIKSVKCPKFATVLTRVLDLYINERIVTNAGYFRTYLS